MIKAEINSEGNLKLEAIGDLNTLLVDICVIISKLIIHLERTYPGITYEKLVDCIADALIDNKEVFYAKA